MDHDHHNHHAMMNHSMMDATTIDPHAGHNMGGMDHSMMNHSMMDHSGMDHSGMDHSGMDHSGMDHSGMDHSNMNHSPPDHSGMKMYFHCDVDSTILFSFWQTSTWGGMLGSCIAVFLMATLYEGLKVLREYLLRRCAVQLNYGSLLQHDKDVETKVPSTPPSVRSRILSCGHVIQSLLHILQVVLSYFLMLIFMTYNVWLCIAVALGAGTGYFLFGWRRAVVVDINEHCH